VASAPGQYAAAKNRLRCNGAGLSRHYEAGSLRQRLDAAHQSLSAAEHQFPVRAAVDRERSGADLQFRPVEQLDVDQHIDD
jgi:hypothetical protein